MAPGQGSVAIVRISGPAALAIAHRLFHAPGNQPWESHRVLYGHVLDPASGERVDEALLILMQAPRSFTREDVVEFHCHGGLIAVGRVLELVLAAGARRAGPGEFSQRAFLNGRLDLTQAEAIGDLITARSRRAAQLAMAGLDGGCSGASQPFATGCSTSWPNSRPGWISRRICRPWMPPPWWPTWRPFRLNWNDWWRKPARADCCARG